jgi:hypothetical protein
MDGDEEFPRELTPTERELLLWLLPKDRTGYTEYRKHFEEWKVVARGRRGEGNYIVTAPNEQPDNESPLPQLLAYGVVESKQGTIVASIRERLGNQIEYEIVNLRGDVVLPGFEEIRRWTFSYWLPSQACPACGTSPREVRMHTESGRLLVLAVCAADKRLWVYDERSGINHPIPVTNFYNELMLHKNIRDPQIALDSAKLFSDLSTFSDGDFIRAFVTYNKLRMKVVLEKAIVLPEEKPLSLFGRVAKIFSSR